MSLLGMIFIFIAGCFVSAFLACLLLTYWAVRAEDEDDEFGEREEDDDRWQ